MLHVETITDFARLLTLRAEWDRLEASLELRTPFSSTHWALNWWSLFRRANLMSRDELRCFAIRDDQNLLVAIAPMFVTHRPGFGPLCLRELQFFGADPYVTEWRGIVCHPDRFDDAVAALTAKIEEEQFVDVVQWRGLAATSGYVFPNNFASSGQFGIKVFYLTLPGDWDNFRQRLPRNIKESLRKCYNSISRDGYSLQFNIIDREEELDSALDVFFDLHKKRASATDTVDHPDVFASPRAKQFLRTVCHEFAHEGRLKVFQLVIADEVVATRIGFVMGDQIFMYFSGYDLRWSRYSVMTTTVAEAIKWSIANGLKLFNLSTGEDISKTRWRPECAEFSGGYSFRGAGVRKLAISTLYAARARRFWRRA